MEDDALGSLRAELTEARQRVYDEGFAAGYRQAVRELTASAPADQPAKPDKPTRQPRSITTRSAGPPHREVIARIQRFVESHPTGALISEFNVRNPDIPTVARRLAARDLAEQGVIQISKRTWQVSVAQVAAETDGEL